MKSARSVGCKQVWTNWPGRPASQPALTNGQSRSYLNLIGMIFWIITGPFRSYTAFHSLFLIVAWQPDTMGSIFWEVIKITFGNSDNDVYSQPKLSVGVYTMFRPVPTDLIKKLFSKWMRVQPTRRIVLSRRWRIKIRNLKPGIFKANKSFLQVFQIFPLIANQCAAAESRPVVTPLSRQGGLMRYRTPAEMAAAAICATACG